MGVCSSSTFDAVAATAARPARVLAHALKALEQMPSAAKALSVTVGDGACRSTSASRSLHSSTRRRPTRKLFQSSRVRPSCSIQAMVASLVRRSRFNRKALAAASMRSASGGYCSSLASAKAGKGFNQSRLERAPLTAQHCREKNVQPLVIATADRKHSLLPSRVRQA